MASTDYSPPRKRQRMSSPAYDFEEMTASDFDALDELEEQLSQKMLSQASSQKKIESYEARLKRSRAIAEALAAAVDTKGQGGAKGETTGSQDIGWSSPRFVPPDLLQSHQLRRSQLDEPLESSTAPTGVHAGAGHEVDREKEASVLHLGFFSAARLPQNISCTIPSPSPEAASEMNYAAWLQSESKVPTDVGFRSAKSLRAAGLDFEVDESFVVESDNTNLFEITGIDVDLSQSLPGFRSARTIFPPSPPNHPEGSLPGFVSARSIEDSAINPPAAFSGFQSAKSVEKSLLSTEEPGSPVMLGFQSARTTAACSNQSGPSSIVQGRVGASDPYALPPEVVRRAQERMQRWEEEDSTGFDIPDDLPDTPTRPPLRSVRNIQARPISNTPDISKGSSGFTSPAIVKGPLGGIAKPKAFKSPLLPNHPLKAKYPTPSNPDYVNSPLNPIRRPLAAHGGSSAAQTLPNAMSAKSILSTTATATSITPRKALGFTPRRGPVPSAPVKKFVTPFKSGFGPGEPGRARLEQEMARTKASVLSVASRVPSSPINKKRAPQGSQGRWFDMTPPPDRQTLSSCGLVPRTRTRADLESLGINVEELKQITPATAMYYAFRAPPSTLLAPSQGSGDHSMRGTPAMLAQLLAKGCHLATQAWVDNHWGLILWKLAGMVCLDPEAEKDPRTRRWCWEHVLHQFLYRYEKELEGGARPPFRLIAAQDTPASLPMVLCVTNVTWSSGGEDEGSLVTDQIPWLELTDGWYKLRAEVDGALARAIRKGKIRIGRKICVQNARLSSDHKEAAEALEAYDRCHLVLSGNSCHLAPWHEKLGFRHSPSFVTLGSLNPDGGIVTIMDLKIVKVHPVAFIEYIELEDGKRRNIGGHDEKEERKAQEQWEKRREVMAMKWREGFDNKIRTLEGYASRLEQKAGSTQAKDEEDDPPPELETYLEDLEEGSDFTSLMRRLDVSGMRHLCRMIHRRCVDLRETSRDDMEKDLAEQCPPRKVNNFKVIVAEDARTCKRRAYRRVHITIWEALHMYSGEGGGLGMFAVNRRFLVTNLIPDKRTAWMDNEPGAEIYLKTRRDSRWIRMN